MLLTQGMLTFPGNKIAFLNNNNNNNPALCWQNTLYIRECFHLMTQGTIFSLPAQRWKLA